MNTLTVLLLEVAEAVLVQPEAAQLLFLGWGWVLQGTSKTPRTPGMLSVIAAGINPPSWPTHLLPEGHTAPQQHRALGRVQVRLLCPPQSSQNST